MTEGREEPQLALELHEPPPDDARRGDRTPADPLPGASLRGQPPGDARRGAPETCALVGALERLAEAGLRRRVLVARAKGEGRELLGRLARSGRSWAGFEVATPLSLAARIVEEEGKGSVREEIDEFGEQRLLEQALDDALAGDSGSHLGALAEKVGFREAVRRSVKELRLAGLSASARAGRSAKPARAGFVLDVLRRYEDLLHEEGLADEAWTLACAAKLLEESGGARDHRATYLLPGHSDGGLQGDFLHALRQRGAVLLPSDPVAGLETPRRRRPFREAASGESRGSRLYDVASLGGSRCEDVEVFRAASIGDELRGVLRRALEQGARWDEIEIVTPAPGPYGSALHAIAESLGIRATYAAGLPAERTRPGRVVAAYFRWIESQFAESVFRGLVEAGDVQAPGKGGDVLPRRLAEALRGLRIGYRRERYMHAVDEAEAALGRLEPSKYASPEGFEKYKERRRLELAALKDLLGPVLDATPQTDGRRVSPSEVATGVLRLLERVAPGTEADRSVRGHLERRLKRIEAELRRPTGFGSAAATVQGFLRRPVAPPGAEGEEPWTSAPGRLHLSSVEHGGLSGRPFTFVVGMDAANFPGPSFEDPLLSDRDRIRLGQERLRDGRPSLRLSDERARERRFRFAEMFAGLRGRVAVSYASWEPVQARELAPAAEALQALRLSAGDPAVSFTQMADRLATPESRLPRRGGAALLDRDDVWLHALSAGDGRLRRALGAVARGYSGLAAGLAAADALAAPEPSVHAGFLGAGTPPFSFQDISSLRPLSAGVLENLGACPRRFLFRTVLGAYPPNDPEFDPGRWLNALERGALLHRVYERALSVARERKLDPDDDEFETLALAEVERASKRALNRTPSPSDAVRRGEVERLRDDAKRFVRMIRDTRPHWLELEMGFGGKDGVEVELGGRSLRIRGAIDRVDDMAAGSSAERGGRADEPAGPSDEPAESRVAVIDYKTGSPVRWDGPSGVYDGGRRLQHVVYAAAVRASLGRPMERMEYHFPTCRGENEVRPFSADRLKDGGKLVAAMLDGVESGCFPATNDPGKDCRFCDYQEVCGVESGPEGLACKPAAWTARRLEDGSAPNVVAALRAARDWESGAAFP